MRLPMIGLCMLLALFAPATRASVLVNVGDRWRFLPGSQSLPDASTNWISPDYDDASWPSGPGGFSSGYGVFDEATPLPGMTGGWSGIRFRRAFVLPDPHAVEWLVLRVNYADGFVAFLNGVEVARRNLPGEPGSAVPVETAASVDHDRGLVEVIDLTAFRPGLRAGTNVLALQGHNRGTNDTTFSLTAELLANITRGPYLQNASSNRIILVWTTPIPSDTTVDFGFGGLLDKRVADTNLLTEHEVMLEGLEPGIEYDYRIGSRSTDGRAVSESGRFRTLRPSGAVSFLVVGDTGSGQTQQRAVAEVMRRQPADLVVHLGDVIYPLFAEGWVDSRCLSVYRAHMREVPWFFALGNHDLIAGPWDFLRTFRSPTNDVPTEVHTAVATSPEHYYSFDHGDVHFVVLYQPYVSQYLLREGDPQHTWLTNDLARTSKPWRLVFLHHPLQTSGGHRFDDVNLNGILDRTEVKNVVLPLAQRYGVQVVFAGHDHNFERFIPTNGVHTVVSGGGGIVLYSLVEQDGGTAQFHYRHQCARVIIDGPELRLEAIGHDGAVFDRMTVCQEPTAAELSAAWHAPAWPAGEPGDGDGNVLGQTFDFRGASVPAVAGEFSNLGRFHANHDGTNLFVGFSESMLYGDSTVFLFLEGPRLAGVPSLAGLGNGLLDPQAQGADGLDFLTNIVFDGWAPTIGCVVGDELADEQRRSFLRPAAAFDAGQGVFRLDASFGDVPGARIQQFNRSPQTGSGAAETSADFIEVAIPFAEFGGLQPGELVRVGAVAGRPIFTGDPPAPAWALDRGFVGTRLTGNGSETLLLRSLPVRLGPNPDPDGDGIDSDEEQVLGTDPAKPDTDGDGLTDGWEVRFAFDPLSDPGAGDGEGDADGDRMTNNAEQSAGTDPRNPGSRLALFAIVQGPDRLLLIWETASGRRYQVQESRQSPGGFADLLPAPRTTAGGVETHEVTVPATGEGSEARFYRIRLVP